MNRNKSGETTNVRLFNLPKSLISKYDNPDSTYLFPVPSNQKVNAYLKEIADVCGIHKNLTFHLARHCDLYYHLKINKLQECNFK